MFAQVVGAADMDEAAKKVSNKSFSGCKEISSDSYLYYSVIQIG